MIEFTADTVGNLDAMILFCQEPNKELTLKLFVKCPNTNKIKLIYETKDVKDKELYRLINDCEQLKQSWFVVGNNSNFNKSKYCFVFK